MIRKLSFLSGLFIVAAPVFALTADDYYHSGVLLYQQKRYEQSVKYFQSALQLDPKHWQSYQAMGQAFYMMGDIPTALAMFNESLRIHPANGSLRRFVVYLQAKNAPEGPTPTIPRSALVPAGSPTPAPRFPAIPPDISSVLENNKIFARVGGGYYTGFFGDLNSWQPGDSTGKQTNAPGYEFKMEVGYSMDPFTAIGISLESVTGGQVQRTDPASMGVTIQTISPQLFSASVMAYNSWPDHQGRWFVEVGAGFYAATVNYSQAGVIKYDSDAASLTGTTLGSSFYAGREILLLGVMALNVEGGFHFAKFNEVTGPDTNGNLNQALAIDQLGDLGLSSSNTLTASDLRAASIDFSGFSVGASLEFDFQ
jgi:hypothetical protein